MIQRIQTIFLLVVSALMTAMLFLPLASLQSAAALYKWDAMGISGTQAETAIFASTWPLFAMIILMALIALATIFIYKNRMLQIRFCVFNSVLMLLFYGLFFYLRSSINLGEQTSVSLGIGMVFPIIGIILNILSIRKIGHDEMLVKSLNRIR